MSMFHLLSIIESGGGGAPILCTPAYVTGDRQAVITIAFSAGVTLVDATRLLDGSFTDGSGSGFFGTAFAVSGEAIRFDFAVPVYVNEAKWYQNTTVGHGNWRWQGSANAADWTNIGNAFEVGGPPTQTQTELNSNAAAYRYYRLLGVSGNANNSPWLREIEFSQCTP